MYLGYWFSVIQTLTWSYICRSVTYISWSSDFALHLEVCLMDKCHNWDIVSMWCKDLPHKMYVVQWFCLVSWRLFDGWMLYWRYWFSVTLTMTYKYICRSMTYILWYGDSVLYLENYLMKKLHSLNIGSVWYCSLTHISWFSDFEFC